MVDPDPQGQGQGHGQGGNRQGQGNKQRQGGGPQRFSTLEKMAHELKKKADGKTYLVIVVRLAADDETFRKDLEGNNLEVYIGTAVRNADPAEKRITVRGTYTVSAEVTDEEIERGFEASVTAPGNTKPLPVKIEAKAHVETPHKKDKAPSLPHHICVEKMGERKETDANGKHVSTTFKLLIRLTDASLKGVKGTVNITDSGTVQDGQDIPTNDNGVATVDVTLRGPVEIGFFEKTTGVKTTAPMKLDPKIKKGPATSGNWWQDFKKGLFGQ